jgi:stearoyl-CoA desaturase (delta-9 desaturase)
MASQTAQPPSGMAKPSEPIRNKKYDPKKAHITEEPITRSNWFKHVNWLNVTLIVGVPIYGLIAAYWTPLYWKTAAWTVIYYFMTGLGITAGMLSSDGNSRLDFH